MPDSTVLFATTAPQTMLIFGREILLQLSDGAERVVAVSAPGDALRDVEAQSQIPVRPIPMVRQISLRRDVAALWRWVRLVREERPSAVIAMTPKASLLGLIAAWVCRVPTRAYVLVGLRLEGAHGPSKPILWLAERLTSAAATVVIANSCSLKDAYIRLHLAPVTKLRVTNPGSSHGVDTSWFQSSRGAHDTSEQGSDCLTVGFVGRITADKGIPCLVDALVKLHDRGLPVRLLVIGSQDEPDSQLMLDTLRRYPGDVKIVSAVADVRPFYDLMDVHVLPTKREGFPNVVLEAAAMGIPTITTTATGAVDSILDGVTGKLVPVDDSEALATAIECFALNPEVRKRMGRDARTHVENNYQPEAVVRSLLQHL